jgi:expansin
MNLITLAALAGFSNHVIAQELCTAVVVTVTVTVEPTPEPTPESSVSPVSEVVSSSAVSEVASSSAVYEVASASSEEPCTQETITATATDYTTITVTPTSADDAVQATSVAYSPAEPMVEPSASSSALVISDFVFASTVEAARASPKAASKPAMFAPAPATSSSAPAQTKAGSSSSNSALGTSESGQATFYGGALAGGTCSFSTYTLPSGLFGTALSDSNWDHAANCGACVSVKGPSGNSITAMVRKYAFISHKSCPIISHVFSAGC